MFCPNFSNKEVRKDFDSLTKKVGENLAYFLWDKYEGDMGEISLDSLIPGYNKNSIESVLLPPRNNNVGYEYKFKSWRDDPSRGNRTIRLSIKGSEDKGYFEVVKDTDFETGVEKTRTEKRGRKRFALRLRRMSRTFHRRGVLRSALGQSGSNRNARTGILRTKRRIFQALCFRSEKGNSRRKRQNPRFKSHEMNL